MPQSTNLNVSPYYDDFSEDKNYYKVLFKPGVTVQTRELNNLQSILQSQIEKFGSKFFSNGGIVIPGNFAYDGNFSCIEIESTYKGVLVETYFENFVGKKIRGRNTGVTAKVEYVLSKDSADSTRKTTALYVKYLKSSSQDFDAEVFEDGEELVSEQDVTAGTTLFAQDSAVFRVLSPVDRTASSVGSSAKIEDGIYFIRGYFVDIEKNTVILDPYTNTPSYRVGLQITESIIDSNEDTDLVDNARGFSNYAAPGADRLKISATLIKKDIEDYNDDDFIELFRVENGIVRKIDQNDPYAFITDVLARRTYDESGNYYVRPYKVTARESLNDDFGNKGQYTSDEKTSGGLVPSDDLAVIKVSPGKAYVKGYEVPTTTTLIDYPKPRTTKTVDSSSSNFRTGNILKVNNIEGIPKIGITTDSSVLLHKVRLDDNHEVVADNQIGIARVYDYEYDNNSFSDESSEANLYLFDIQTYTEINTSATISGITNGDYIQGQYSNASGYVKSNSGQDITLYQVSGTFIINEPLVVCGISTITTIDTVVDYSIKDIKSVSSEDGTSFTADSVLSKKKNIDGPFNIVVSSGIATITSQDGSSFASGFKVSDIISYTIPSSTLPTYSGISTVGAGGTSITIDNTLVASVSNVCSNSLGSTGTLNKIKLVRPRIKNYNDSEFYAPLENPNVSEVSFLNSSIFVKKYYTGLTISSGTLDLPTLENTNFVYADFDEERYCVVLNDGTNISLSGDDFEITAGGKEASFDGLSPDGTANVIVTQIKSDISSKFKKLDRCQSVSITRSKYNPASNGLTYSRVYGRRVEDEEISLNYPDIFEVHGVFQSTNSDDPQLPELTISGLNTNSLIIGEKIVGQTSGAVAICVATPSSSRVSFIYKSKNTFNFNEIVTFEESETQATVTNITFGCDNILSEFIVDNGQRKHFYDIGRLIRKASSREPSKKLTIIFDYFKFKTTDSGDIISVNSYPSELYGDKIPVFKGVRNTDTIDTRPRVADYTSSSRSPFDYISRKFTSASNNSANILKSNESVVFDYKFYLPRSDKLTLDKDGNFNIVLGEPSEFPIVPKVSKEVLDVATIRSSAYVFDVNKDIEIELVDHKRYTMSDIRDLETRIENLEYYTSLSLLEVATQNLLIEDADGFNRFKCGFFVDNFKSYDGADQNNSIFRAEISNDSLKAETVRTEIDLVQTSATNLQVTGNSLTLKYSEKEYQKQPFASKLVNINPFNIVTWSGRMELLPDSDRWEVRVDVDDRSPVQGSFWQAFTAERTRTERSNIRYIRSRNIGFVATRIKPINKFDFLFDSRNLSNNSLESTYAFPKLVQVSGVTGSFEVGETVSGSDSNGNTASFRLCTPNHKSGTYNNPSSIYNVNPYSPNTSIPELYGPESTILNVDVDSLSDISASQFFGNITEGMSLVGQSSGALATVSSVELVSDDNGALIGAFFIPNPEESDVTFETGNTTAKVVSSQGSSAAEANFISEGERITTTRITYADPLAQTFNVPEEQGVFVTSVDIFFGSKDDTIPVELQIREVSSGIPGGPDKIVGSLSKVLNPSEIGISADGSVATNFKFDNLTRLEGGREYAVVLISDCDSYNVWVSRVGQVEISTASLPEIQKIIIGKQPSLGSIFKSQNGSTWTPTQEEDLKFTLNRAEFSNTGGTAFLTNAVLSAKSLQNKLPTYPLAALSSSADSPYNDGRHILVYHPNHGMYSENNKVTISGIDPDGLPVKLTSQLDKDSSGPIDLSSISGFNVFGDIPVEAANPGYIKINDEIISYEEATGGQLINITRGLLGTVAANHPLNSKVYKYEFNGIDLREINTTFDSIIDPTIDSYYVQISNSGPVFESTKFGGGSNAYATKNIQFSMLEFSEDFVIKYEATSVSSSVRTVSSTSVSSLPGTEVSFADQGFDAVSITGVNEFKTPRMVCSRVNELEYLPSSQFTDRKSFTVQLNLDTSNTYLSPIINLDSASAFAENYRINKGVADYKIDSRINSNVNDPNAFIYISKRINLTESATSLKVLHSAYRNVDSDIRILYKIFDDKSPDNDQIWRLFPGYNNLDINGNIINFEDNNGRPDEFVPESLKDEYRDYTYSIDNLPEFTSFSIKIVGTSRNQSYSPILKDLRVIALK